MDLPPDYLDFQWVFNIKILVLWAYIPGPAYLLPLSSYKKISKSNNKILTLIYYYTVTVAAQWVGVYRIITGKVKPFWEKAETTR